MRASDRFIAENETRLEVNQRANFGSTLCQHITQHLILGVKMCILVLPENCIAFTGYAVAQWLGIRLQMLGVAMVAGVSLIAVLEHHFNSVDPGLPP